jgi:3',5'-cyclic AMP phosphodiesterase CpdA
VAVLIHLSDIHFRKHSGSALDIDSDLRNELEIDAKKLVETLGPPTAILVGGDIAYSGKRDEYVVARGWLGKLSSAVGVSFANVWCVPGNHDVDQSVIRNSAVLFDLQNAIRGAAPAGVDAKLLSYFGDEIGRTQLYSSIAEFNAFAEPYGYKLTADRPFSEFDLPLNDGSLLRIYGLNSTIVSNHMDQNVESIVLGRYQLPKRTSEGGVTNLVLCHHPPDWWSDDDALKDDFDVRAHIQLYGHKHRHVLRSVENSVRLVAGAVHPERVETGWRPRYNWLTVSVTGNGSQRTLDVKVYPRVWSETEPRFTADFNSCGGAEFKEYSLKLESWEPPKSTASGESATQPTSCAEETTMQQPIRLTNPLRVLTFRLFELPYLTRLSVAQKLSLIRNEDAGLRDYDIFKNVLKRASDEGKLADLWDAVQVEAKDSRFGDNPFRALSKEGT